jgi:hypothetical protein
LVYQGENKIPKQIGRPRKKQDIMFKFCKFCQVMKVCMYRDNELFKVGLC